MLRDFLGCELAEPKESIHKHPKTSLNPSVDMMCGLSRDGFCSWSESCPKQRTEAHLFDAKQLQRACLAFIKENVEAVANTPGLLGWST